MKKLLILAKTIDGGTGTYLSNLLKIKSLFQNNMTISVAVLEKPIYMQQSDNNFYFMKKRNYLLDTYSFSYKNLTDFFKEFLWVREIIFKEKPDIILSIDVNCNVHIGLNKFLFNDKIKRIFTTHSDLAGNLNQKSTKFLRLLLKKLIRFIYNRAERIICVSGDLSNSLHSVFKIEKEIKTIYNGLDLTNSSLKTFTPNNNTILSVARLDKQKDHFTLLKAFDLLTKEIKNAQLLLVGDGPLKDELLSYVIKNNLGKNVNFLGWQKNLDNFFLNSDIFVLSSIREGFPYALIEAMSFGLPIVCTNTPYGPSEILDDGKYGYLVPMRNHVQMKEAILELLKNKEAYKKYSQLALERSSLFTSDRMISDYAIEIRKLL